MLLNVSDMSNMCCNLSQPTDIYFDSVFEDRPLKRLSILVSIVGGGICIPFVYGIIWFEENNHMRTLINQLVASICWYTILWNVLVQLSAVVLYSFGPLGVFLCSFDLVVRNAISMQVDDSIKQGWLVMLHFFCGFYYFLSSYLD